jgi:hypothetical protein
MRDELDRALDDNPDYPPGFDPRELEGAVEEEDDSEEGQTFNFQRSTFNFQRRLREHFFI